VHFMVLPFLGPSIDLRSNGIVALYGIREPREFVAKHAAMIVTLGSVGIELLNRSTRR